MTEKTKNEKTERIPKRVCAAELHELIKRVTFMFYVLAGSLAVTVLLMPLASMASLIIGVAGFGAGIYLFRPLRAYDEYLKKKYNLR